MKLLFTTAFAVCSAFALVAAAPAAHAATSGSGNVVRETRSVSGFEAVSQSGPIDLRVRQAASESVEVEAEDNLLPLIETVVETGPAGRTLAVRFKRGESVRSHKRILVTVNAVQLTSLATAGSGDVAVDALKTPSLKLAMAGANDATLRGLVTDSLEVRISGSGDVVAAGTAARLKLSIAGSGDADVSALTADDVSISIAGSGDVSVTANKTLDVSVAGSGSVRYGGAVTAVRQSVAGSGSVRRR